MSELRIPHREQEESRWWSLHPWLWAAGVKTVRYRYEDIRTNEIVIVYEEPPAQEGKQ